MNYQNFEFKSYTPTPTDQYMLGLAKIKLYGKVIVVFKHVKTKDGSGTFFCTQNYSLTDGAGEKKYVTCAQLDSRDDEVDLMEFIRENVNKVLQQRSTHQAQTTQAQTGQYYPHGMVKNQSAPFAPFPAIEVAADEQLPF